MKQLTVRGLDDELYDALKAEAKHKGVSLNRYVLSLLQRALGFTEKPKPADGAFDDLDYLAGTWTQEEAEAFDLELQKQREIDKSLWETTN